MFGSGFRDKSSDITGRQAMKDADMHSSGPFGPRFTRETKKRTREKALLCLSMAISVCDEDAVSVLHAHFCCH